MEWKLCRHFTESWNKTEKYKLFKRTLPVYIKTRQRMLPELFSGNFCLPLRAARSCTNFSRRSRLCSGCYIMRCFERELPCVSRALVFFYHLSLKCFGFFSIYKYLIWRNEDTNFPSNLDFKGIFSYSQLEPRCRKTLDSWTQTIATRRSLRRWWRSPRNSTWTHPTSRRSPKTLRRRRK